MFTDTLTGPNWTAMLDQMQQSLARILTEVEERERATNFAAVVASTASALSLLAETDRTDWQRSVTAAAEDATEVVAGLAEVEEALRAWLARAMSVGQALANVGHAGV